MIQILFWLLKIFGLRQAKKSLKQKSVLYYLKALQGVRLSIIGVIVLSVLLQIMILGLAGLIFCVVILWPNLDMQLRLYIGCGISAFLFLIPLMGFSILLSGRTWYKMSGAAKMLQD